MSANAPFPILFEDNHLLVVNKPAGLVTQGAPQGQSSLAEQAKDYLKRKYSKPGNVYLGIVSRLDAMVTGVIVLARTSKAASRLSQQFRDRTVRKVYWAIVPDHLPAPAGELIDYVRKNESQHRMVVCGEGDSEAQLARLRYRTLQSLPAQRRLIEIELDTGRKHQIRIQLASRDCAIIGDRKYDSPFAFPAGIALHARELGITHPTTKSPLSFVADLPSGWGQLAET